MLAQRRHTRPSAAQNAPP